jgi:hypothetical protein
MLHYQIMKIERLEKPNPLKRWAAQRCSQIIQSTCSDQRHCCTRAAMYKVDGVMFCRQHTGEAALNYLLNQQNTEEQKSKQER